MKVTCVFLVIMLNQHIGHCSRVEPSTSRDSTKLQRIPSDKSLQELKLENVQLTEYKNGEIIELQQQNFFHLQREALREFRERNTLFEDPQFPKELFLNLSKGQEALRPKVINNFFQDIFKKTFFLQEAQEPVLFIDNEKPFGVEQGQLGDCWFIVALLHLQYNLDLFKFIVSPNDQSFNDNSYAGIFHFKFWQAGTWVDVVIDDRLPTEENQLVYASSRYRNEFWPALIEKAYAKLLYRSYEKLTEGFSRISMQDLSGGISETYWVESTSNSLFKIIQDAKDRSTMISCGTVNEKKFEKFGVNVFSLSPRHSYAITAVKIVTTDNTDGEFKLIRIRDPHGTSMDDYHGDINNFFTWDIKTSKLRTIARGESWILYEDFIKYFECVQICNLTPNKITHHVYSNTGKKLALSALEGKFMGAVCPKLIKSDSFYEINPLYRMVLTKSDEGKNKSTVLIGVSLKRRHDLQKLFYSSIHFRVISFEHDDDDDDDDDTTRVPKPLFTKLIGEFKNLAQVSKRIDLEPGTYYIIPYTYHAFKGATFYLQILSEQQDILEVFDRDIVMPPITKTLKDSLTDDISILDSDIKLFEKISVDSTINFKDLYNILKNDEFSLNENCHMPQELDDTVVLELELLATKNLVPQRKLSYLTIAKTILTIQEVIEKHGEKDFPGYIKPAYIRGVLERARYSISMKAANKIYQRFRNPNNKLIHFNDYISIVFAIKNKFGSYCEEFSAKLCQDLVLMVHDNNGITKFEKFNEPKIHKLRINIQQFKIINLSIGVLKNLFEAYASAPYFSVSFEKLRKLLDETDYKLTYDIIATIFHTHGNDVDIFYHQFVQAVNDVTLIFDEIQNTLSVSHERGRNLNKEYHEMFHQLWKKKQEKKI